MNPSMVDRDAFLQNLRISKLLTREQYRAIEDKLGQLQDVREMAKALATWKLITKFQAKMLLLGRNTGFFLGPYKILDQLGQGGMGRVYKALHQTMNRTVALKILSPQVVDSSRAQQLFLREVQAAAQLSHPNIVLAYDANENEGRHFLAMEYVDGPNLERYVKKHGPLGVGLACEIIFQAANALQYAHEKGMVHRDIKPANLLLQQETERDTIQVKILDFGLARLNLTETGTKTIIARENTVMGTPDFLSPEQSKDLHAADIRSDLYSLGCTFYFLLAGQVPFAGGSIVDKLIRHSKEDAPALKSIRPDVPKPVVDIVRKLMAKAPADRYQTPDELMDALATHASPSAMVWPIPAALAPANQENVEVAEEIQVDTEPRAQGSTEISDADSILDWVDVHRKRKRFWRRMVIGVLLFAIGAGTLAGALIAWSLMGEG